ncbi:AAA family ATPase [Bacillus cereus group sp. MG9]|uniref:AAA family ATPase n=1 Tax=Bacillus cereus group sp. MG9 TaxID=3040247 RepID=UPI00339335B9
MKLLYMYIESFGDLFQDISFDFSNEYKVCYDKTHKTLTLERNELYLDGFYGDVISDITAIVGKNGSGKTTILELIGRTLKDRLEQANVVDGKLIDKYFMIFLADDDTYYFEGVGIVEIGNISGYDSILEGSKALARSFYFRKDDQVGYHIDKSYDNKVRDRIIYLRDDVMTNSSSYLSYLTSNEIYFIPRISGDRYSWSDWYEVYLDMYKMGMIQSPSVQIMFKTHNKLQKTAQKPIVSPRMKDEHSKLGGVLLITKECMDDFFSRFISVFIDYLIFLSKDESPLGTLPKLNDFKKEYVDKVDLNQKDYQMLFQKCISIFKCYEFEKTEIGLIRKYIEIVSSFFDALYEVQNQIIPDIDGFQLHIPGSGYDENIAKVFRYYSELQEFVWYNFQQNHNNEDWDISDILQGERYTDSSFSIVLPFEVERIKISTGEKKILQLFSKIIYELKASIEIQPIRAMNKMIRKNHIVLVDEIEATMHLEWSRNLLDYIMTYINRLTVDLSDKSYKYSELEIHVQLIATTHSPFLLSDLNRSSIIALEVGDGKVRKKGNIKAFAQNIQRVMNNEFFLEDCYGAFAQRKIKGIIDECNVDYSIDVTEKRRIKLILNEIGEPILRKKLEEKFIQRFNSVSDVHAEELELVKNIKLLYSNLTHEQVVGKLKNLLEGRER